MSAAMLAQKKPRRPRKQPKVNWHVASAYVPIETPEKGSELRRDIRFIAGSNHVGRKERKGDADISISQFLDVSTERVLERRKAYPPGGGELFEIWYLLSDEEGQPVATGDTLYEGRYTVAEKKNTPKKPKSTTTKQPKKSDHPRARKELLFEKYSPTSVARLMGSLGYTPSQALHVLTELGVKTTLQSMRTFCYAGKKGERGELPVLGKGELAKLEALRKTTPAPAAGGGRARMSLWGHAATAVLRWMGKQRFTREQATAAFEDLKRKKQLDKVPSPASIGIFLQAGKNGRRGEPAKLTAEQEKQLLTYRTAEAVATGKRSRATDALVKAKAASGGKLPVPPKKPAAKKTPASKPAPVAEPAAAPAS